MSHLSRSFFADSSIHALRFLSLLLRLLSFDFSLCILLAQAGQYFDIPELGTYSTPHTVQFLGFNAVHRFVGVICNSPTKRWTALKPKNCTVCGVEYVPRSGISKYCPACAKKIQREKSNESKRRSRERNRQACIELSAKNDRLIWNSRRDVS